MNLDELHSALTSIADEVSDDSTARLSSVSRRVRATRRRQTLAVFATVCGIAVAFALFPQWSGLLRPDATAPADTAELGSLTTVRDGDLLVYKNAGGVRLLGEKVGKVGARSVNVTIVPTNGNIGWSEFCLGDGLKYSVASPADAGLEFHLLVNGAEVPTAILDRLRYTGVSQLTRSNATCDDRAEPMQVARTLAVAPDANIAAWADLGVTPKKTATITLSATANDNADGRAALAATKLELGVFEKPLHPIKKHRVWIDRHIVDPGDARGAFQLVDWSFQSVTSGRHDLTIPMPTTDRQVYVRTFVVRNQDSGITLQHGSNTKGELGSTRSALHIERLVEPGASMVHAAVAIVPPDTERQIAILVYVRYQ